MSATPASLPAASPDWVTLVREKVESLRFGIVQIVVHDRKVIQIERTEKTRLDPSGTEPPARRERL
ncbi:MAG: YezD family protein [Opitutaceae bacterium]|nr:YezD family protein [Opitutaceae bacterium]